MRRLLIEILIRALGFYIPREDFNFTKEEEDGMLSQIWQLPAFRKRIAERDKRIVFTMAGGEGMVPEPRDKYALHAGQRVENLLLAKDAKSAYQRLEKLRLAKEQKDSASPPA